MTKYLLNMTKITTNACRKIPEHHSLKIKKSMQDDAGRGKHWGIGGGIGVLINIDYILCCLRGLYAAPQVDYAAPRVLSHLVPGTRCQMRGTQTSIQMLRTPNTSTEHSDQYSASALLFRSY